MKTGLFIKLAIGIIVVFGLLLAGFALYEPVWFKYYEWRLCSDNPETRDAAAEAIADKGARAMPYIKEWLNSKNDLRIINACLVLEKMDGDTWEQALPELEAILEQLPSDKTAAAAPVFVTHDFNYLCEYNNRPVIFVNVCLYVVSHIEDEDAVDDVCLSLPGVAIEKRMLGILLLSLKNSSESFIREWAARALAGFDGPEVSAALMVARARKNKAAAIALAWRNGGADLEIANRLKFDSGLNITLMADAQARWGNADAIEQIIDDLTSSYPPLDDRHAEVLSLMPDGFPKYDFKSSYTTQKKPADVIKVLEEKQKHRLIIKEWYEKNKHRLAWNPEIRKYYIKPEEPEQK